MANQQIYISKGGQPPGPPCSPDDVRQMISSGDLSSADLAWCEGLAGWAAIPEVMAYAEQQNTPVVSLFSSLFAEINTDKKVEPALGPGATGATLDRTWKKIPAWLRMGNSKKRKRITQAQMGEELWSSCKIWSREFFTTLNGQIAGMGFSLNDKAEFVLLEEILVMHLWIVCQQLASDPASLEVLQRNFLSTHARIAGSFHSEEEKNAHIESIQNVLRQRFGLYEQLWDRRYPQVQTVIVGFMLKQMFKGETPHPSAADPHLLGLAHSYLLSRIQSVQEWRGHFLVEG